MPFPSGHWISWPPNTNFAQPTMQVLTLECKSEQTLLQASAILLHLPLLQIKLTEGSITSVSFHLLAGCLATSH